LRQAHKCGGVKPINGIRTRHLIIVMSEMVNCWRCYYFCFRFMLKLLVIWKEYLKNLK